MTWTPGFSADSIPDELKTPRQWGNRRLKKCEEDPENGRLHAEHVAQGLAHRSVGLGDFQAEILRVAEVRRYPWQQRGESPKGYWSFEVFRNLEPGERALTRVASECTKSVPRVYRS